MTATAELLPIQPVGVGTAELDPGARPELDDAAVEAAFGETAEAVDAAYTPGDEERLGTHAWMKAVTGGDENALGPWSKPPQ